MAWTYSDWVTYSDGSASRLSRLRLHIQEVSDALKTGSYSINGRRVDKAELQRYIADLMKSEPTESAKTERAAGNRVGWVRAKARLL